MPIKTALTSMLDLEYPLVLAPMGGVAGGRLAAAVSEAGGLGLVGGGYGEPAWLERELPLASRGTSRAWGVGFITWNVNQSVVEQALAHRPPVFMLSFGDPRPYVSTIKAAGCVLICQVQNVAHARAARDAGADLIVAQGTEAGGHGADRGTLPLVPAVTDAVAPTPTLAAGGIADGRGVAAALTLGAQGALLGTRFYAAVESLGHDAAKRRLTQAGGDDTRRTRVFDIARGHDWPAPYTGRAIRNRFLERWEGREHELAGATAERPVVQAALDRGDFDTAMVWAGEGVDLIAEVVSAGELVRRIGDETEACLRAAAALLES